ncbi:hypothetical protein CO110_07370 [Candidatus Desantisbacteria bacterium CG_4_9_14_3_um_filter_40_11]|uniref:Fe/B12 periplasmic-binding domain-containing protein n=4 Tax=unclassified Candidatus Desantisiibacteriota TaxID=3106372 RepID=A0A2M7P0F0_9BACT|nr:MAG: hypothetical protein COX18_02970 [Candidatus Desantisbacteria bacterium CG23_combo_of_CG06-09_8_20_14_all_40_23]PIY18894.1 MAG: hypothetical protein COZ13_08195 [Candidatus Desantisbacteria bacterium CG_4_10_14_3_um_filter_40_18]PJB29141.1 MAG: hypothetical protein CO110_07370 [Candidatus Desantisbacteria bacterium CG_4_9_14_3_um_filter_40_11]
MKLGVRCQVSGIRRVLVCGLLTMVYGLFLIGYANGTVTTKGKITGYDDFGRKIVLAKAPERIVLTSGTHIDAIFELGAGNKVVGIPNSVIRSSQPPFKSSYPETVRRYPSLLKKPTVGDFGNPNIEKIISLNPDLIIIYDSADSQGKYSEVFEKRGLPYAAFCTAESVDFGLKQIKRLGILLGKKKEAEKLVNRLKLEIDKMAVQISSKAKNRPLVYYWWYGSGNGTYGKRAVLNELINVAGGINLAGEFDKQWFEISPEYVISRNPDVIIISYYQEDQREESVKEIKTRPGFSQVKAVKNNQIYTINGSSLHSPLLFPEALRNLAEFIHPEVFRHGGTENEK